MDGHTEQPTEGEPPDAVAELLASVPSVGMSRRDFTAKVGVSSAAAVGIAWAAPNIRTIKFAAKAVVGSPPPTSTTTSTSTSTTVPIGALGGKISISSSSPCIGETLRVNASGFAPKTAVTLQLDSAANSLGVATADSKGRIEVALRIPSDAPTGPHTLMAVGVQTGGRTLTLTTTVQIKTAAQCEVGPEGSTSTTSAPGNPSTTPTTATTSTTATTPTTTSTSAKGGPGVQHIGGEGALAFTGTDAIDLALVGAAATVGGRLLYGLARPRDDDEEDE